MKKLQRAAVAAALTAATAVGLVGVGAIANATTAVPAPHPGGGAVVGRHRVRQGKRARGGSVPPGRRQ